MKLDMLLVIYMDMEKLTCIKPNKFFPQMPKFTESILYELFSEQIHQFDPLQADLLPP
jgi:hypothetical protein